MSRSRLVARNILLMTGVQFLSWGLTTTVMLYLPRYVGDVGLGRITLANSFAAMAAVFVHLGTSYVLVREIAARRGDVGDWLVAAWLLRIPSALIMVLLCILIAQILGYPGEMQLCIAIACVGMLINAGSDAVGSILRGQENFARQSLADLAGKAITTGLTLLLIFARAPLWALVGVAVVAAAGSLVVGLAAFRKQCLPRPSFIHVKLVKHLVIAGIPFVTTALFLTIYGQVGPVILHYVSGDAAVGWYGLARRLTGTAMFIPTMVTGAMLPTLVRLREEEPERFMVAIRRMLNLMLLCVAPLAVGLICLRERVSSLLQLPANYEHAMQPVFVVSGVCLVIWFITQALATALIANEQQTELSKGAFWGVLVIAPSCFACSWLTGRYFQNGAVGAVVADNLTEFCLLIYYLWKLPRTLFARETVVYTLRIGLCAIAMAVITGLASVRFGVAAIVPGLIVYGGLCWMLRCISRQDVAVLRSLMLRNTKAARLV